MANLKLTHCRCNICDRVSDAEIAEEISDVHYRGFVEDPDPNRDGYICSKCADWVSEVRHDFYLQDEGEE